MTHADLQVRLEVTHAADLQLRLDGERRRPA
jgi:hypothetical protein